MPDWGTVLQILNPHDRKHWKNTSQSPEKTYGVDTIQQQSEGFHKKRHSFGTDSGRWLENDQIPINPSPVPHPPTLNQSQDTMKDAAPTLQTVRRPRRSHERSHLCCIKGYAVGRLTRVEIWSIGAQIDNFITGLHSFRYKRLLGLQGACRSTLDFRCNVHDHHR